MLKRINEDGLTPNEVVKIAEYALMEASTLHLGKSGRPVLKYPDILDFGGGPFTAQAILMDGEDWASPRLYGVIPKGWRGRK